MNDRFEEAFIQCLREGIYPGPSNINERYRKDRLRLNKLNGEKSKQRLALMYEFGVPYQRGRADYSYAFNGEYSERVLYKTGIPDWPYIYVGDPLTPPQMGHRKHEIQDPNLPWKLRRR